MLKPKALTQVLSQANTGNVIGTMLLNKEGVLLAFSGYGESNACVTGTAIGTAFLSPLQLPSIEDKTSLIRAMVSSIWGAYEKHGHDLFHNDSLNTILLNCEVIKRARIGFMNHDVDEGKVGVRRMGDLLLCICAKESIELGLLKAKLDAVAEYLDIPLRQVSMT